MIFKDFKSSEGGGPSNHLVAETCRVPIRIAVNLPVRVVRLAWELYRQDSL